MTQMLAAHTPASFTVPAGKFILYLCSGPQRDGDFETHCNVLNLSCVCVDVSRGVRLPLRGRRHLRQRVGGAVVARAHRAACCPPLAGGLVALGARGSAWLAPGARA